MKNTWSIDKVYILSSSSILLFYSLNESQDENRLKEFLIERKQEKPNRKQNTNKKQKIKRILKILFIIFLILIFLINLIIIILILYYNYPLYLYRGTVSRREYHEEVK